MLLSLRHLCKGRLTLSSAGKAPEMKCGFNYNSAALRLALMAALLKLISLPATAEVSNHALQLCERMTAITPDRVLLQMPRPQGMTIKWRGSSDVLCLYSHDGELEQALQAPLADSLSLIHI